MGGPDAAAAHGQGGRDGGDGRRVSGQRLACARDGVRHGRKPRAGRVLRAAGDGGVLWIEARTRYASAAAGGPLANGVR